MSGQVHNKQVVGALPGVWTQLGKGPTSVGDNTEVTLLNVTLSDGEIPFMLVNMKTDPTGDQYLANRSTGGAGNSARTYFCPRKKTDGSTDFNVKHNDGGARDIDWVAYKVTPA